MPPEYALVYMGKPFLTDDTDEDIFLAMDFGAILEAYNAIRTAVVGPGEEVYLEPVKIRDLVRRVIVL